MQSLGNAGGAFEPENRGRPSATMAAKRAQAPGAILIALLVSVLSYSLVLGFSQPVNAAASSSIDDTYAALTDFVHQLGAQRSESVWTEKSKSPAAQPYQLLAEDVVRQQKQPPPKSHSIEAEGTEQPTSQPLSTEAPAEAPAEAPVEAEATEQTTADPAVPVSPADPLADKNATYIGQETCMACHPDQAASISKTPMGRLFLQNPRTEQEKLGCEGCHGPGSGHLAAGGGRDKAIVSFRTDSVLPVSRRNGVCRDCHKSGKPAHWQASKHKAQGLACASCHKVHRAGKSRFVKATAMETCFQCHSDKRPEQARLSGHPVVKGKLTCTSCHNPHGNPKRGPPTAATADPLSDKNATYVGQELCVACHADQAARLSKTLMGRIFMQNPRTSLEKLGCEGCHGPGSTHVATGGGRDNAIVSFRTESLLPIDRRNGVCLDCHENGDRTYWRASQHQTRGVACANCHKVHQVGRSPFVKATEIETCFQCHKDKRAKQARISRHPLVEGKMACTSCHNPHGTANQSLLNEPTVNDNCYNCHAEKRGPFLWEHAPVRENCANCHDPHGTNNFSMLTTQPVRLCQQCHAEPRHPSQPQNPLSRLAFSRGCTNCHGAIHGSNSPSGLRFQR